MKKKLILLLLMGSFYSLIGIIFQAFAINLAMANAANGQEVKSVKEVIIEIEFNDATAEEIFNEIESEMEATC